MRLRAAPIALSLLLCAPAFAQRSHPEPRHAAPSRPSGPPHAFLFGTWTGGLFPVLDGMLEQDCRMEPSVVFGQDVVAHSSLTSTVMTRRVIETVRTSPAGAEFRLTPDPSDPTGFGCEDANVLHVAREEGGAITFPHCAAFPYPLRKCPVAGR
jgi:hypothetical protein